MTTTAKNNTDMEQDKNTEIDAVNVGSVNPIEKDTSESEVTAFPPAESVDILDDLGMDDDANVDEPPPTNPTEEALPQEFLDEHESSHKEFSTIKLVAIPFINDGANSVQLFYNSIFQSEGDTDAVHVAEKYFFECFENDDIPRWDGVLLCQYDFAKGEIIKDDRNGFVRLRDFKTKWLWKVTGARENVTFTVKCTMPKVWASHFQSFLREMENYGRLGHSGQISFMADGDGNFRPKFKFTKEYEPVQGMQASQITRKAEQLFDAG